MWRTSRHNALVRVSKSRIGDSRSDLSFQDRSLSYSAEYTTNWAAWLQQLNGISREDRLEDSPMRNSPVGYKPTVLFRKTYSASKESGRPHPHSRVGYYTQRGAPVCAGSGRFQS